MDTSNEPKPTEPMTAISAPINDFSVPKPIDTTATPDFSTSAGLIMPSTGETISPEGQAAAPVMPPTEAPEAPLTPANGIPGQGAPVVHNPMSAQPQGVGAPKKKNPTMVIIIAIVVALLLAGTALLVANSAKKKTTIVPVVGVVVVGANSADVTEATNAIDTTLASAIDSVDFGDSDLTDINLSL